MTEQAIVTYRQQDLLVQVESLETQLAEKDEIIKELEQEISILKDGTINGFGLDEINNIIEERKKATKRKTKELHRFIKTIWKMRELTEFDYLLLWEDSEKKCTLALINNEFQYTRGKYDFYFGKFIYIVIPKHFWWRHLFKTLISDVGDIKDFKKTVLANMKKIL